MSLYSLADDEMKNSYYKAVLYIPGIGNNLNNLRLADFLRWSLYRKQGVKTYVLQSQNFFITDLEAKTAADLIKEDFITVSSSGTQNLVNFHNERPQLYIDPILNPVYFFQSLPSNKSQSLLLDCISKLHDLPITSPDHDFPAFLKSLHYSSALEFLVPFLPDPMKLHNNMIFYLTSSCSIPSTLNIPIIKEPKSRLPFGKLNREMMVSSLIISLIS